MAQQCLENMFWIRQFVHFVIWAVLFVNMFNMFKIPLWKNRTPAVVISHHIGKLDDAIVDDLIQPDEPNITLLSTLFDLRNPGFNGSQVVIDISRLPKLEAVKYNKSLLQRGFSSYVSNLIPLQRHLPDIRKKGCGKIYSRLRLPKVSVVIAFHNVHWSTLLRTVHSVVDNDPRHLIEMVLLVDDASTDEVLQEPLQEYVTRNFLKVSVRRTTSRNGLARARNLGFEWTSAPVVIFLDSTCECFPGWLEPLVARIAENKTVVTTPLLHGVRPTTFGVDIHKHVQPRYVTFPELRLARRRVAGRNKASVRRPTDPYESPAMVGCVIAVSRVWFTKLGMFDPGLEVWGGENTELSLKTWMCGGSLEIMPCSNVACMYHSKNHYKNKSSLARNIARIARVWLDDYKVHVLNNDDKHKGIGDVSRRIRLRQKLKCHSFDWYLRTVSPETYIFGSGIYSGEIRNVELNDLCIYPVTDRGRPFSLTLERCSSDDLQTWRLTELREIRNLGLCFEEGRGAVELTECTETEGKQAWRIQEYDNGWRTIVSHSGRCMGVDKSNLVIKTELCSGFSLQQWRWRKQKVPSDLFE